MISCFFLSCILLFFMHCKLLLIFKYCIPSGLQYVIKKAFDK